MESTRNESSNKIKLIKEEIKYSSSISYIEYNNSISQNLSGILGIGDSIGRISIYDVRMAKPVNLIKNKNKTSEIK